jgi:hypothetical protein
MSIFFTLSPLCRGGSSFVVAFFRDGLRGRGFLLCIGDALCRPKKGQVWLLLILDVLLGSFSGDGSIYGSGCYGGGDWLYPKDSRHCAVMRRAISSPSYDPM